MATTERRPIEWRLLIPIEVRCEYAGVTQGEYYTDLEKAIEVCQVYPGRFRAATGYLPDVCYPTPVTGYEGIAALGGELVFPPDHQPMIRNQAHILESAGQIDALQVPDPWKSERFLRNLGWHLELKRRFGDKATNGIAGMEGPVTNAVLLRGQGFFMDCVLDPKRAHHLMDVCTEMIISWTRADREIDGLSPDVVGIADDHSGLLSPDMWPEFVLPYYRRIIDALGPNGCWMHTELVRREHLHLFRDLNLVSINLAENQYLTPQDVFEELPGVPFGWHILTVSEMLNGTPRSIRERYREILDAGVEEVRCELAVGTPVENIRAYLEIAREMAV